MDTANQCIAVETRMNGEDAGYTFSFGGGTLTAKPDEHGVWIATATFPPGHPFSSTASSPTGRFPDEATMLRVIRATALSALHNVWGGVTAVGVACNGTLVFSNSDWFNQEEKRVLSDAAAVLAKGGRDRESVAETIRVFVEEVTKRLETIGEGDEGDVKINVHDRVYDPVPFAENPTGQYNRIPPSIRQDGGENVPHVGVEE